LPIGLLANEGKGEHRVRVTFDRPLFDTSKIKKAQDSVAEENVRNVFGTVFRIKMKTMIQLRAYIAKEIRGKESIYRFYCFEPKITVKWKNVVCNKPSQVARESSPVILYLSTI